MVTVTGVSSGDHECWCLLVDKATFVRLRGDEPDEGFDVGPFAKPGSPYKYKLYPGDLIGRNVEERGQVMTLSIEAVVKGEGQEKVS
jgi:hypothetical protein